MLDSLLEKVKNEPTLLIGLLGSLLLLGQEFGLPLTDGQETALNSLTVAVLAFWTRRHVVPSRTVIDLPDDLNLDELPHIAP